MHHPLHDEIAYVQIGLGAACEVEMVKPVTEPDIVVAVPAAAHGRIYPPTEGKVTREGRCTSLLSLGLGANIELSAHDNIVLLLRFEGVEPTAQLGQRSERHKDAASVRV